MSVTDQASSSNSTWFTDDFDTKLLNGLGMSSAKGSSFGSRDSLDLHRYGHLSFHHRIVDWGTVCTIDRLSFMAFCFVILSGPVYLLIRATFSGSGYLSYRANFRSGIKWPRRCLASKAIEHKCE